MKMMIASFCSILAVGAPAARAAYYLDMNADTVVADIEDAAKKNGDHLDLTRIRCGDDGDHCRYDAGEGVDMLVTKGTSPKVQRIDGGWNNERKGSTPRSASRFTVLCHAIVAAAKPALTRSEAAKIAVKITLTRPVQGGDAEAEERQRDVVFFGSRDLSTPPDFPGAAFVQCGAMGNAENP